MPTIRRNWTGDLPSIVWADMMEAGKDLTVTTNDDVRQGQVSGLGLKKVRVADKWLDRVAIKTISWYDQKRY
jgi:hypothetical protein